MHISKHIMAIAIISAAVFAFSACTQATTTEDSGETVEESITAEAEAPEEEAAATTSSYLEEAPQYLEYTQAMHKELKEAGKPFAVFFHASWCPTCIALEKNIKAELSTFPKGTKILKADFDTETDLKKEYGISVQSTVAIVDAEGSHIKTLAAPGNAELKSEIEKSL